MVSETQQNIPDSPCPLAEWLEHRAEWQDYNAPDERVRNPSQVRAHEMPDFVALRKEMTLRCKLLQILYFEYE